MMISAEEKARIRAIVNKNGKGLRASKPKSVESDPVTGRAAYVWRNVAFAVSTKSVHQCLPVCADFYLCKEDWDNRREVCKALDELVTEMINEYPPRKRHGLLRWGKALGY